MPDESREYSHLHPDKTRVSITLAKVFVLVGGIAIAGFTFGGLYADHRIRLAGIDARIGDLPSKREVREEIRDACDKLDVRIRELLRSATLHCPLFKGRGSTTWVECKVVFPSTQHQVGEQRGHGSEE